MANMSYQLPADLEQLVAEQKEPLMDANER
jgi:hypothetical protein